MLLKKYFTREHSLFYASVWRNSNCKNAVNWIGRNLEQALYLRPAGSSKVEVYYSDWELAEYDRRIADRIHSDPDWFSSVVDAFKREWEINLAYIKRSEPLTREELRDFYEHWVLWWEPMAISMQAPGIESLSQETRDESYRLRAETQEYANEGDRVYKDYMRAHHPELEKYVSVLLPEEVLEKNIPSISVLDERLNGWFLTNDGFGLTKDLNKTLTQCDFVLEGLGTVLSKVFSREKPLVYFCMWDESDRLGFREFLEYDVRHNVFIVPPKGKKGTVWYSQAELDEIMDCIRAELTPGSETLARLLTRLDAEWDIIRPYLDDEKAIDSVDSFQTYYEHLLLWWSAMTTATEVPNLPDTHPEVQETVLIYRAISEKYPEKMSKLLVFYWERAFPNYAHLSFCITPAEIISLSKSWDDVLIRQVERRVDGCALIDEKIYALEELDAALEAKGLVLEDKSVAGTQELKGATAYQGLVRGTVRKILSFSDMAAFQPGEILVTEMTNPEYVPIMKIAGAVVTDEGGVTCHAAIASRELKIPCVVGTRVATQVLKDGDRVEVDASAGVVRKLEP